jgi:hypothetical protein
MSVAQLDQLTQFRNNWTKTHECCPVVRCADSRKVSWHQVDLSSRGVIRLWSIDRGRGRKSRLRAVSGRE